MYGQRRTGDGDPSGSHTMGLDIGHWHRILTQGLESFRRVKGGPETALAEGYDS